MPQARVQAGAGAGARGAGAAFCYLDMITCCSVTLALVRHTDTGLTHCSIYPLLSSRGHGRSQEVAIFWPWTALTAWTLSTFRDRAIVDT